MNQISQLPAATNMDRISPAAPNFDRISQLPAGMLEHILSFLPFEEAARMSGVSTTWKNAYNSLPCLNFERYFLNKPIEKLVKAVDSILAYRKNQKIFVEKFSLHINQQWSSLFSNWIDTLVDCKIKELNLVLRSTRNGYTKLPEAIFNAKALNVLKLSEFHIKLPSNSTIMFSSSLRELHLQCVYFDEEFMQALCTSCINLEVFMVRGLKGLTRFQTSLPKLKKLQVTAYYSKLRFVDIRSPNIEDLDVYGSNLSSDYFKNESDLNVVIITNCCKALKSLQLNGLNGVAMTQKWFDEIFTCLKNIEKLDLGDCDMLKTVKISGVFLKQLRVYRCDNVIAIELDTPNLIEFSYDCSSLPNLKLKASASLEANIKFDSEGGETPNSDWYSKLVKFLDNFNHSMALELTCKSEKGLVIPKDVREHLFPPLYGTNRVKVRIHSPLISYSVVDILDGIFWLSPQLDTLSYSKFDLNTLEVNTFIFQKHRLP
ncbi:hypothetical protein MTR67_045864 [Solanum verrucosum]|uniref:F-box domain-containing protein n=1 Tax=Solanum verrucosum TaxID=315347 RepID=A0AAF0UVG8_SOLVR|nr:hypothetical protein MTR67_045864 [Solanum verrucosum]